MHQKKTNLLGMCLAVAFGLLLMNVSVAIAQRDAGGKVRGEFGKGFWSNARASRYIRHARDYSQDFYQYSRDARTIEPEVAKSESTELGRNIVAAKKELATVGKEYADNNDVLARLMVIEDHLDKAVAQHHTLHMECHKDAVDTTVGMSCCNVITKELEKAMAEHAALMRKLEINLKGDPETSKSPDKGK